MVAWNLISVQEILPLDKGEFYQCNRIIEGSINFEKV